MSDELLKGLLIVLFLISAPYSFVVGYKFFVKAIRGYGTAGYQRPGTVDPFKGRGFTSPSRAKFNHKFNLWGRVVAFFSLSLASVYIVYILFTGKW